MFSIKTSGLVRQDVTMNCCMESKLLRKFIYSQKTLEQMAFFHQHFDKPTESCQFAFPPPVLPCRVEPRHARDGPALE